MCNSLYATVNIVIRVTKCTCCFMQNFQSGNVKCLGAAIFEMLDLLTEEDQNRT